MVPDLPSNQAVLLLPIIYVNLDSAAIPSADELDTILSSADPEIPSLRLAAKSLNALPDFLNSPIFPPEASRDLWPRVFKWMDFIHTYWDYLPEVKTLDETQAHLIHLSIILHFSSRDDTARLIVSTPGARIILAGAWAALVRDNNLLGKDPAFREVVLLLLLLKQDVSDPENFGEIVAGVGGSLDDLAALAIKQISHAAISPKTEMTVGFLGSIMAFLNETSNGHFNSALISKGIVAALVATAHAFADVTGRTIVPALQLCFMMLIDYLGMPPGYPWVIEALNAGLLRAIVAVGVAPRLADLSIHVKDLLLRILPSSMVYYSVVAQLNDKFSDIEALGATRGLAESTISREWQHFSKLATERVGLLEIFESDNWVSMRGCDNMQCGTIDKKRHFDRCSHCASALYCSRDCQKVDWRNGHREACQRLRSVRLRHPEILGTRERAFLHAVLFYCSTNQTQNLLVEQAIFMHVHPGEPFSIAFDYTKPDVVVIELLRNSQIPAAYELEEELPVQHSRASRNSSSFVPNARK
ncbi:hypothetical protein B0H10DRAFT_2226207 [Mycena sp. CBHHK59/15]|nr:hypothetical protein B0H10DRAFT_2226207 [Mycena sp. CBHHK59/15]